MNTEAEAKTKWCPMSRVIHGTDANGYDVAANSFGDGVRSKATMCIASACMMWRKTDQIGIGPNGEKRDRDMDGRTRWVDRGYCGLTGKI